MFQYVIDAPVSLERQRSAMLPIVNGPIEAEKVSIYDPNAHPKHPLNGLKLKNSIGRQQRLSLLVFKHGIS